MFSYVLSITSVPELRRDTLCNNQDLLQNLLYKQEII